VPLRSFTAPDGTVWRVWNVTPLTGRQHTDRRVGDRRSPDPVLLYKGRERRTGDRRKAAPRTSVLGAGLEKGWLVFESERAKKRLAPPPDGWESCPECDLVELWQRAYDVPPVRRVL
jgi:hypothetical protein